MILQKNTLIEGVIIKKGTELVIGVEEKAPQMTSNKPLIEAKENAIKALNNLHSNLEGIDNRANARKVELMIPKIKDIRA